MSRRPLPEDPGLAIERTLMAWGRTSLGLVGIAALLIRFGEHEHELRVEVLAFGVAAVALVLGGLCWSASRRAYAAGRIPFFRRGELRAFAVATTVISVGTAAAILAALV